MSYAILFKKKSDKQWRGATLAKKNVSLPRLRAFVSKNRRPGFDIKIISVAELKKMVALRKRRSSKRMKRIKRKRPMRRRRRR